MEKHLYVTGSISLLWLVICLTCAVTQALSFDSRFSKVNPGYGVTGKIGESYSFTTLDECIVRCSGSAECMGFQYNGTQPGNCLLISDNSTSEDGTTFMSDSSNIIIFLKVYASGSIPDPGKQPTGWSGLDPILYWSLDNLDGLLLMEGNAQREYDALTEGKVNGALKLSHTNNQWVDLGLQTEACLVVPQTCDSCSEIMSSFEASTGFMIYCFADQRLVFWVAGSSITKYQVTSKIDDQWVHLVLSFINPTEGIQVFKNGALVPGELRAHYVDRSLGEGKLVLGRQYKYTNRYYSSLNLDELVFFNRKLMATEVETIYNGDN